MKLFPPEKWEHNGTFGTLISHFSELFSDQDVTEIEQEQAQAVIEENILKWVTLNKMIDLKIVA